MKIAIATDSTSGIYPDEAQQLGISVLPMPVTIDGQEYLETVNLEHDFFFRKQQEGAQITTSQPAPADLEDLWNNLLTTHDAVLYLPMTSGLSSSYASALALSDDYDGKVAVVDTRRISVPLYQMAADAKKLADRGLSLQEIRVRLEEKALSASIYLTPTTLEYLKKGGRISAATAAAGTLLSIKPAIAVCDGEVVMAGKARGNHQGNLLLEKLILEHGGVNFSKPVALVYSGLNDDLLQKFIAECPDLWGGRTELPCYSLGCAIGTHVGPGAYGVAFFEE